MGLVFQGTWQEPSWWDAPDKTRSEPKGDVRVTSATQLSDAARAFRHAKAVHEKLLEQSAAHERAAAEAKRTCEVASEAKRRAYAKFIDIACEYADSVERQADHEAEEEWPER